MTRSSTGFCGQRLNSWSFAPSKFIAAKPGFARIFPVFFLALILNPVMSVSEAGFANAQNARNQARGATDTHVLHARPGKRVRARYRATSKPKKSFLGGLFGGKPVRQKRSKPFQGLKSFFNSFQAPARSKPGPTLRESFERRMREAAQKDALLTKQRLRSGFFGWGFDPARGDSSSNWRKGGYRTMCVRMCDGYYFPVSFKTSSRQLENDEHYCNSNCYNAPTKLFYYSNPGGSIEDMRSTDGTLYRDIANAFKYRKTYVADCRCKAEPWSRQARQQHESWGLEAEIRQEGALKAKGDFDNPVDNVNVTSVRPVVTRHPYERY